jgi:hypothetical protein
VTTTSSSPAAGRPSQPFVVSNRCRPITVTVIASQNGWTWSAEVRETWNVQPLGLAISSVSPLPYQSNSGPTESSG